MSVFIAEVFGVASVAATLAYLSRNESDGFLRIFYTFTSLLSLAALGAIMESFAVSETLTGIKDLVNTFGMALVIVTFFYFMYAVIFRAYIEGLLGIAMKQIKRVMTGG